ncbi:MAG: E2 ligase fold family C protein [Candidatus Dormibacteraeota bacterium]|nr:E2 ligase fold family C protein [Candidatus Dormibacteraeota bacterium]
MALADYYYRSSVAASQALSGYDQSAIENRIANTSVGIGFTSETARSFEGQAAIDMLVRLFARLYPRLAIWSAGGTPIGAELAGLATLINPGIELTDGAADIGVWIGPRPRRNATLMIYAGSSGWRALVGCARAYGVGTSRIPFGGGAAACLAAANVFRMAFLSSAVDTLDVSASLATADSPRPADVPMELGSSAVLVGAGAIGQAVLWAIARSPLQGSIWVVDHEEIDLGNLQRYVLTDRSHVGQAKASRGVDALANSQVQGEPYRGTWESFVDQHGSSWHRVVVALDSAQGRRNVQASLPQWIGNGWTQPGDLGVSFHAFGRGACLSCLYLSSEETDSEDVIVARALGVEDQLMQVRTLLYHDAGIPDELLSLVSERLHVDENDAHRFQGTRLRDFYQEGICGGALVPIGQAGTTRTAVHVPLAHQSALAGVLLGAGLASHAVHPVATRTRSLQLDVMRPLPPRLRFRTLRADPTNRCICRDRDYLHRYRDKFPQ